MKKISLLLVALLFAGCATTQSIIREDDTNLLIGQIKIAVDFGNTVAKPMKGSVVRVQNNTTGQKNALQIDENGIFFLKNFEPGKYSFTRIDFKAKKGGTTVFYKVPINIQISVSGDSEVVALSPFKMTVNPSTSLLKIKTYGTVEEMKSFFINNYPESGWESARWKEVSLN